MKHIKTFEDSSNGEYWLIRTDEPYLSISLNKLNLPKKQKDYLLNNPYVTGKEAFKDYENNVYGTTLKLNKIFIPDTNFNNHLYTSWMPYKENSSNTRAFKIYDELNFTYKGEVNIEPYEIEAFKYNL
jgi:hypothetical protein